MSKYRAPEDDSPQTEDVCTKCAADQATNMYHGDSGDPLVALARQTIEEYVSNGRTIIPSEIPGLRPRRAGVFVSLHLPDGSLRGCIGTLGPTQPTIEEEIVNNAISSATRDPRFSPLCLEELEGLDISVDVLGEPEEVKGLEDLDPQKYGLILQTDTGKRALLLPDLEGVDTPEQQFTITCQKGSINPRRDTIQFQRFQVDRHH